MTTLKIYSFISIFIFICSAQAQEVLLEKNLTLKTTDIDVVLNKTEKNIKLFVDYFIVRLDAASKIINPKKVSGTINHPVLNTTIKKCVFFICQTIDLDAEFSLEKTNGPCDYNYQLIVDLQRSSQMLTDLYSHINTDICINKEATQALVNIKVILVHAQSYSSGIVQKQAYGLISVQGKSILESFKKVMTVHGVKEIL